MSRWTCPNCDREVGRRNQTHLCVPGCTVEETFAAHPEQLPAYEAIVAFLETLGPVHADVVSVGVFLKTSRTVAEVRPRNRLFGPDDVDDEVCARLAEAYDTAEL